MNEPALDFHASVNRGGFRLRLRLTVGAGELLAVLGPNGSGKSTLLRAIAGLAPIAEGRITLHGRVLDDVQASVLIRADARRVGMVFQDSRLFEHLRVIDNVAYAPRTRGASRSSARATAQSWLDRLGIGDLAGRRSRELSGGQAQRVAIARAFASDPAILLLDEPFAALDVQTRAAMQTELSRLLESFAGPAVLVTHDPLEALILADRIAVIENGRLVQQGTPAEITARPLTPYVAGVVGTNLYRACSSPARGVVQVQGGGQFHTDTELSAAPLLVALRPSAVTVHGRRPTEAVNVWCGMIESLRAVGDRVRLDVEARPRVCVDVSTGTVAELGLAAGVQIWLSANPVDVSVYPVPNEDHSTVTKSMSSSTARSSEASTSQ